MGATKKASTYMPFEDEVPELGNSLDDYQTWDEQLDDVVRSTKSFRGIAYQSHTDDSSRYDGGWDTNYGYEG